MALPEQVWVQLGAQQPPIRAREWTKPAMTPAGTRHARNEEPVLESHWSEPTGARRPMRPTKQRLFAAAHPANLGSAASRRVRAQAPPVAPTRQSPWRRLLGWNLAHLLLAKRTPRTGPRMNSRAGTGLRNPDSTAHDPGSRCGIPRSTWSCFLRSEVAGDWRGGATRRGSYPLMKCSPGM